MLRSKQGAEGYRKPVRVRRGPATVTGERTRAREATAAAKPGGKAKGGAQIREPGDWPAARYAPDRGEDPEKEVSHGEEN